MKLFGREDIDLLDEIGPELQWPSLDQEPVVRYRAELRETGGVVIVRKYPRADHRFRAAVELSKQIWYTDL